MKRILFIILILSLILFLVLPYTVLPRTLHLSAGATALAQPAAVARVLQGGAGEQVSSSWKVVGGSQEGVLLQGKEGTIKSVVALIASGGDRTLMQWKLDYPISGHPLRRWKDWLEGRSLQADASDLLRDAAAIASTPQRLYGQSLREVPVSDSLLLSTTGYFARAEVDSVYALARILRTFAAAQGVRLTDSLMVYREEEGARARVRVAFPVSHLPQAEKDSVSTVRMVRGLLLEGRASGGPARVKAVREQMGYYLSDGGRIAPAIPYEVWETNRQQVQDTAKWKTRLYFPVI